MSSEDAQWLQSRNFQAEEIIGRIFRIPLHKAGLLARSTFSNIEQQSIEYVQHTVLPWARRWESVISRDLLNLSVDENVFFEFNLDGLLRGDTESRFKAYSTARQNGLMTTNEIRRLENLNPVGPEGDVLWAPVNMQNSKVLVGQTSANTGQNQPDNDTDDTIVEENDNIEDEGRNGSEDVLRVLRPITTGAVKRCLRKESQAISKAFRKDKAAKYIEDFYIGHVDYMRRELRPIVESYVEVFSIESHRVSAILTKFIRFKNDESQNELLKALDQGGNESAERTAASWFRDHKVEQTIDTLISFIAEDKHE